MLEKLLGKYKGKKSQQTEHLLSPGLGSTILNVVGSKSIPTMPAAAQKAFSLATNPQAEIRDFIEVIESDEALSARIIKIANSVYFDRGSKPSTIEEAVTVIGLNEIRSLLNASALSELFPTKNPIRQTLWANDIATALIAKMIMQRINASKINLAFLAGLMHDVGKLLLLQRCAEEYSRVIRIVEIEGVDFCKAEERRFPFTHTEVGQLIAEQWNFSLELRAAIADHHLPWPSTTATTPSLSLVIKCADTVAHALGLGQPRNLNRFKINKEQELIEVWKTLNISTAEQKNFLDNCNKIYLAEFDLYTQGQPKNPQIC